MGFVGGECDGEAWGLGGAFAADVDGGLGGLAGVLVPEVSADVYAEGLLADVGVGGLEEVGVLLELGGEGDGFVGHVCGGLGVMVVVCLR